MQVQDKILNGSAKSMIDFINAGPSPYHVVQKCKDILLQVGFKELSEKSNWSVLKGGKYFVTKNQSSVVAFAVGRDFNEGSGFSVIGAHTDSPCFQVKPVSKKTKCGFLSVGVQCYGGGIWNTWFDRDLTVAGRVLVKKSENDFQHSLVLIEKPILRIPHLCIHLQRDMNDMLCINKETHTLPIIATEFIDKQLNQKVVEGFANKHHSVMIKLLCDKLGCNEDELLDMDLCLADTQKAAIGGAYDEFIFAPRLDNLFNVFCSLEALISSLDDDLVGEKNIRMIALYDNEEVGSQSAQGAGSMFTEHIMRRLCSCLNVSFERCIANSFLVSADQAHAVHPNYPEKHEDNHRPGFHKGMVVKINANQKYATTAVTSSMMRAIAAKCDVPLQDVVVRNDSACGSTIGPILATKLGIRTMDIGGPQLAMHSIREVCCTSSVDQAITLFKGFFQYFPAVDQAFD